MRALVSIVAACLVAGLAWASGPSRPRQGRAGGAAAAASTGKLIGGTLTPATPDARGWGWQVKASINPATPRPFYNKAKELLFQDKQITSYTISTYNPESLLRGRQTLRLHLVRDAAQHDVVRRGAPDDRWRARASARRR